MKVLKQEQNFQFILYLLLFFSLLSCSSSKSTRTITPPPDFDASKYYNPEDFKNSIDSLSFNGASIKGSNVQKAIIKSQNSENVKRLDNPSKVVATIYLDEKANIDYIKIIESPHPSHSNAVKNMLLDLNFEPAKLNGKPVRSLLEYSMEIHTKSK